jgi:hypothetical protein
MGSHRTGKFRNVIIKAIIKFNKKVRAKRLITQLKLRYSGLNNALEFVGVLDEGLFVRYSKKKTAASTAPGLTRRRLSKRIRS